MTGTLLGLALFATLGAYVLHHMTRINKALDPERRVRLMEEANRDRDGDWTRHRGGK